MERISRYQSCGKEPRIAGLLKECRACRSGKRRLTKRRCATTLFAKLAHGDVCLDIHRDMAKYRHCRCDGRAIYKNGERPGPSHSPC